MLDLALIHAPSVYDFRKRRWVHYGPISDVVPSTPIFDMYPIGFFSIASYLESKGYRVGIYNIAARMVLEPSLDVEKLIRNMDAGIYAIDLHWMVHAHGALELAKIIKEVKDAPVVLGGLSATLFYKEILEKYPYVDVIVLGDTTEPILEEIINRLERGQSLESTPNIAYRDHDKITCSKIRYVPYNLDQYAPRYDLLVKAVARTGIKNAKPYALFEKDPITAILMFKGCIYNCITCGGSNYVYVNYLKREKLGVKSVETIIREIREISERFKTSLFIIGDPRLLGKKRMEEMIQKLRELSLDIPLFFEFFEPPNREELELLRKASERVYLQLSPESHDPNIRRNFGRPYDNESLEKFVKNSASLGFERLDLYFMVGLPGQNVDNVSGIGFFFKKLYRIVDRRINAFVAPLAPFVDPGSLVYNYPRKYGYNILARSLGEHRSLLEVNRWYDMLNYETFLLDRRGIALATYNAVESLLKAKFSLGVVDEEHYTSISESIKRARENIASNELTAKETTRIDELYPSRKLLFRGIKTKLILEYIKWFIIHKLGSILTL